jgi:drug/metabolite transporter (DMT)-like permease
MLIIVWAVGLFGDWACQRYAESNEIKYLIAVMMAWGGISPIGWAVVFRHHTWLETLSYYTPLSSIAFGLFAVFIIGEIPSPKMLIALGLALGSIFISAS